jgi:hypothetical protein
MEVNNMIYGINKIVELIKFERVVCMCCYAEHFICLYAGGYCTELLACAVAYPGKKGGGILLRLIHCAQIPTFFFFVVAVGRDNVSVVLGHQLAHLRPTE